MGGGGVCTSASVGDRMPSTLGWAATPVFLAAGPEAPAAAVSSTEPEAWPGCFPPTDGSADVAVDADWLRERDVKEVLTVVAAALKRLRAEPEDTAAATRDGDGSRRCPVPVPPAPPPPPPAPAPAPAAPPPPPPPAAADAGLFNRGARGREGAGAAVEGTEVDTEGPVAGGLYLREVLTEGAGGGGEGERKA